jgi:hypothetical protein
MRTTVLGLSACLSACVSTLPVANTGSDPLPPAKPVQQDQTPKPREQAPAVTRVVQAWTVNLESRMFPFEAQRPALLDSYANRLVYVVDRPLIGETLHRMRLGFFASQREAEQARVALSSQYPHAYVARAGSAERTQAAQHALAVNPPVDSYHDAPSVEAQAPGQPPSSLQMTAMSALGMARTEAPSSAAADVPPPAVPATAYSSQAPEGFALSVDAPAPQRGEPATEVSYGRDENESLYVRSSHNGGDVFTVATAFSQHQDAHDLQKRAAEEHGFWQLDLSSGDAAAGPAFEMNLSQSSFDPETSEGFGASENRLVSFATQGSWQGYQLGLGYQTVGTEFEKPSQAGERKKAVQHPNAELKQGRESTQAWIARQFGDWGLKTHATLYEDQVDEGADPITTQKVGASLNYTILSWPQVGVTVDYARGVRSGGAPSGTGEADDVDVQSVASSLYYAGAAWSGTLYLEDASGAGTDSPVDLRTYYLGGSYYPWSTFSLSPGLSYTEENYTEWGSTTDSYAASMTASYKPSANSRYSFNGYSEYSTQQNLDWALDTRYYYNSVGVDWVSAKPKPLIKQWSFELFHDQYVDNVYSESNTGGFGVWLTMKSAPSPVNRFVDEVR